MGKTSSLKNEEVVGAEYFKYICSTAMIFRGHGTDCRTLDDCPAGNKIRPCDDPDKHYNKE